jgi:hypothetical protein
MTDPSAAPTLLRNLGNGPRTLLAKHAALRGSRTRLAQKPAPKWRSGIPDDASEAQLRTAIAQIGLARARQILEEVEETFAGR